jgi:hypothetical protein
MEDLKANFQNLIIENIYSKKILNNSHRGDVVEMMVLGTRAASMLSTHSSFRASALPHQRGGE